MKPLIEQQKILEIANHIMGETFVEAELAAEGIDHVVLIVTSASGKKRVIKTGENAGADGYVLKKLNGKGFKAPELYGETTVAHDDSSYPVVVMSCFGGVMLKDVPDQSLYIADIIGQLKKIHSITSEGGAGYVLDVESGHGISWKEFLIRKLTGKASYFNWDRVYEHSLVDAPLVQEALAWAIKEVSALPDELPVRLIHTDINGTNIFVTQNELEGIIDWSDAKFGDPIFDFARMRMYLKCYTSEKTLQTYFSILNFTEKEEQMEKIYYVVNVLEYTNWYVRRNLEERIMLMQSLLKEIFYD